MVRSMQENARPTTTPFIVRPETQLVRLYRFGAVVITVVSVIAILFTLIFRFTDFGSAPSTFVAGVGAALAVGFFYLHVRLRSMVYTVMPEFVEAEADMGIFGRYSRRIPVAYIRDVTSQVDVVDRFYNVGSVTVSATNGDSITLENIADAETAREVIWQLVQSTAGR